jgi:N-acetylneuraminic acid mutarotase
MKVRWLTMPFVAALLAIGSIANAHFPWIVIEGNQAKVYFSEAAAPEGPDYLDRLNGSEVWSRGGRGKDDSIALKLDGDAMVGDVNSQASVVFLKKSLGVLDRGGGEPFLLQYYAKAYTSPLPGSWKAVADKEKLPLEVTPTVEGDNLQVNVTWKGENVKGAEVALSVADGEVVKLTTDEKGNVTAPIKAEGLYSIRAKHVEPIAGQLDDKAYASIRHYSTLSLPVSKLTTVAEDKSFPALKQGFTSYGAAVVDGNFYAVGGYSGGSHDYYAEAQSKELLRISLSKPQSWEVVSESLPRTGTAMVAYKGKLYRIGGFVAKNKEGDPQDLESQSDVQCFDPAKGVWTDMPSLPLGRSSHDAVCIGDTIYVVGGWKMDKGSAQGGDGHTWQETALALDLSAAKPEWKEIAAPGFKRRALQLASHNGKVYAVGGMQETGGPTTEVMVYDPKSNVWSSAGKFHGGAMDGFGAATVDINGTLVVTTMSGSVQTYDDATGKWNLVGQLKHPRFFHRIAPIDSKKLLVVGGSNMSTGKIDTVETVTLP